MEKTTLERVQDTIIEILGTNPESVTPEAKIVEDLGADSLDAVELIMALEEEFGGVIDDEDAEKLITVQQIVDYIETHSR